jgi:hypothetical protein
VSTFLGDPQYTRMTSDDLCWLLIPSADVTCQEIEQAVLFGHDRRGQAISVLAQRVVAVHVSGERAQPL